VKKVLLFSVVSVLIISISSASSFAQQSPEDLEGIELELQGWKKIESDKSDVLVLTISFINNGKYTSEIIPYVYLVDSQERRFDPSTVSLLQEKGFPVTNEDCPYVPLTKSNPGLSSEENLCYEVPKGIGDSFSLELWSTLPALCEYVQFDCTIKSFPVTIAQQSEPNNSTSKIPAWVKNIFVWYSQDQVSEDELLNAIKYLITEGILVIPSSEVETTETKVLTPPPKQTTLDDTTQSCSGSARCISGTVTRIVDGDTIHVDGQSIRFALVSAPELHEDGGTSAKQVIEIMCPVGSKVLVDEDDGQQEGSYGRIVAVVYCDGINLNALSLDLYRVYLSSEFCYKSEFSSEDWVQEYGCGTTIQTIESCDPSYPDVCIATSPPDLDCKDVPYSKFTVLPPDPHRFDGDKDGIGCESN